ncbi:EAL domain-containing protein [Pseudomonas sp. Au-Pse12]|uniref:EAL domain-containing protein n=1 Tax=Pseudomonas sp. Au-Pse12 TaxID=2906459 RepID=UPI001E56B0A9|nr:EAL domain-containing protein [Pseudomonas sp. Au-Pse12]MCE4052252.1 EAL domain-containing protein [Pseudomonas sp. Au-Pse12]
MKNSSLSRINFFGHESPPTTTRDSSVLPEIGSPLAPSIEEIRNGLHRREFIAYYQPKLSLLNGSLAGAEVLARWDHPQRGLLAPGMFLPGVFQDNLLPALFSQIFEQGLRLNQSLSALSMPVELAFNLQPEQLSCPRFSTLISTWLSEYRCPPTHIMFEITETGSIHLPTISLRNLLQLRLAGCGLSMDDFGTGFSSLERLCDLPFNQLKLDGSFVRKLEANPACRAVVENTVRLASTLGLSLVVEGVETPAQLQQLKALGCTLVQGFAIARPMPEAHFISYCLHNASLRRPSFSA